MKLNFWQIWATHFRTLMFWRLYVVEKTGFNVKKKIVAPSKNNRSQYFLILESINKKHEGTLQVVHEEFYGFKKGEFYKELSVVKSKKNEDYTLLSKELDRYKVIGVEWAKAFLMTCLFIAVFTMVTIAIGTFAVPIINVMIN